MPARRVRPSAVGGRGSAASDSGGEIYLAGAPRVDRLGRAVGQVERAGRLRGYTAVALAGTGAWGVSLMPKSGFWLSSPSRPRCDGWREPGARMTFDVAEFRRHFPSLEPGIADLDGNRPAR